MERHKILKLTAFMLAIILALTGCVRGAQEEPVQESVPQPAPSLPLQEKQEQNAPESFSVPYDPAAGFDPYRIEAVLNGALLPLMYDPLVKLDTSFMPQGYLAQSVEVSGTRCTVKLRQDVRFWDGTALTAQDVTASIAAARTQGSYWSALLDNIANVSVIDNFTVLITLAKPDREFASLLTFPVTKAGNSVEGFAVGSGRYIPYQEGASVVLRVNEGHIYAAPSIKEISLVSFPDRDSLGYSIRTGDIDYLYSDLSAPDMAGVSGGSLPVNLNNLVYLGMNSRSPLLSEPAFRKAIEAGIDRAAIVAKAYSNRALAAYSPLNPAFAPASSFEGEAHSIMRANELLDSIGYSERDENGARLYRSSPMRLRLLVASSNRYREDAAQLIKEQLSLIGITVDVVTVPFSEFKNTLAYGSFDLYLAEAKLPESMNIASLITPGEPLSAGVSDDTLSVMYDSLMEGATGYDEFLKAFSQVCPFVPLLYRQGAVIFSRGFYRNIIATNQDIFYNISEWKG